jgi:single-stranded DNA-binding protein
MIDALTAGRLYGKPVERTSKGGGKFVTAKMRVPMPDGVPAFANIIAFRDHVCAALLALADGASVAIAGELKISVYASKDGSHKPSLDLTAHEILTEFHVNRRRRAMTGEATETEPARSHPPNTKPTAAAGQEDFNDEIPF